jgi:hypothetical protein
MAGSFLKENHKFITIFLCVLSIALILTSQLIPYFTLDADKNIGGIADINLKADFYQARVDFTATAKVEAGGFGGIIGGIADLGGGVGDDNITISEDVFYYEGLERLQGVVGVLYDTTKNADYTINPQTFNSINTKVYVNTHTDLIPFWPEGIGQEITVTVRLNQTDDVKSLRINKVWIDIFSDWNESDRKYRNKAEEAWSTSPGDLLYEEGDEKVYKHAIAVQRDWGERVGIIAKIDVTLTDNLDESGGPVLEPFTEDSHPQEIINIRPIGQGSFISILLMFISLPMSALAAVFAIIGIIFTFLEKRRRKHILFTAALLEIFAVVFFINGANTLLGLIEFLKVEDYTWNAVGIAIPAAAGGLLLVTFLIEMIFGPKDKVAEAGVCAPEDEIKFDISGAMAEEEEEGFECPACGEEFSEMVAECPKCGAEFEEEAEEDEEEEDEYEEENDVEEEPEVDADESITKEDTTLVEEEKEPAKEEGKPISKKKSRKSKK